MLWLFSAIKWQFCILALNPEQNFFFFDWWLSQEFPCVWLHVYGRVSLRFKLCPFLVLSRLLQPEWCWIKVWEQVTLPCAWPHMKYFTGNTSQGCYCSDRRHYLFLVFSGRFFTNVCWICSSVLCFVSFVSWLFFAPVHFSSFSLILDNFLVLHFISGINLLLISLLLVVLVFITWVLVLNNAIYECKHIAFHVEYENHYHCSAFHVDLFHLEFSSAWRNSFDIFWNTGCMLATNSSNLCLSKMFYFVLIFLKAVNQAEDKI